ncbi:digestive cysteine proteinase 2-like isoform X2 [Antedon mediterranea]|uniref:digestive cysteine proteinase 2-like isoform X2 n=1 Tax=Antedon mediterranea TaxID=105859 RepID=UPI003AF9DEF7
MKIFLCVLLVGVSVAKSNPKWEMFKKTFDKAYTAEEEIYRRSVFEDNQKFIQKHNAEFEKGLHTYTVGINKFADLTDDEFVSFFLGYLKMNTTTGTMYQEPSNFKAQNAVDWTKRGYVTPVKDQKYCQSGWAFSAAGSVEGQHFRRSYKLISLSEQQLMDCSRDYSSCYSSRRYPDDAFKYIKAQGIESEKDYPYKGQSGVCKYNASLVVATVTSYGHVSNNERSLMSAVGSVGPISAMMDARSSSFRSYRQGVYSDPRCSRTYLNHGVLIVGYGDDLQSGKPYWLIKNSWGTSWGMRGYFKISRTNNTCGITTRASYPRV